MLSFLVFEGDRPQRERVLRHAHILGPESVPIAGEIRFEGGVIHCTKPTAEAGALGIQVGLDQQTIDELTKELMEAKVRKSPRSIFGWRA